MNGNETVGMYNGGIVVGFGDVTVTNGSQVNGNSNNGPGGGIAANFGGKVSVSGGSQVNDNTGAAIGGGIVNFSGPLGSVEITGGSQVNGNSLTNGETLGRAIVTFLTFASHQTSFHDFAIAIGGDGGVAMLEGLERVDEAVRDARGPLIDAVRRISHPLGVLVAGGGIGTLLAPICIADGSQVNGNFSGENVLPGNQHIVGLAGGIFHVVGGEVKIDQSQVDDNQAPNGDGGGIWLGDGTLTVKNSSSVSGNTAAGAGGGLFNSSESIGTVLDSIFQGNQAEFGGGMANEGTLTVCESILADNTAMEEGGGIFCDGGELILDDVVFDNNSPDDVAGNCQ